MSNNSVPGVLMLQVTWQQLLEEQPSGNEGKPDSLNAAAAVVTSQRVLILGPDLTLKAATPQRIGGAVITSALWVGPALLFCDSAGAVSTSICNEAIVLQQNSIILDFLIPHMPVTACQCASYCHRHEAGSPSPLNDSS